MHTKITHLLLVLSILVLSLAACSSTETPVAPVTTSTSIAESIQPSLDAAGDRGSSPSGTDTSYTIVDTGQAKCYDDSGAQIACPADGEAFYGQDAQYSGNAPNYTGNGDGTVSDNVTGLMWQQSPDTDGDGDIDEADKLSYAEALAGADTFSLAGYDDWRLPTIKELYSLIDFSGLDPNINGTDTSSLTPFIDTDYFDFAYGDTSAGERIIDAQYASSTKYVATTMNGNETMFGVNFADGRIKGYPTGPMPGQSKGKGFYVLYVRGNPDYGVNDLADNGDGTITDAATGLTWMQADSGVGLNWEEALAYCESLDTAGYDDWRLPNAKELQSIVDYGRSPDTSNSAAIDPLFNVTAITNEAGQTDYPFYWSSTTHANWTTMPGAAGAYVAFGRAMGYMNNAWLDVHGAGAQRSDPKSGDPADYPTGRGPQGDTIRIYNYARCVRGGTTGGILVGGEVDPSAGSPATPPGSDLGPEQPAGEPDQHPDLAAAAAQLGISEEALREALGDPRQGPPDFAAAAQQLGITEEELIAALGVPPAGQPPTRQPPQNRP
jgi:hypothetical protein